MDFADILPLLEQLDDEIDDLEDSLAPVLKTALSATSSRLPLLDKAKLYILLTYAIESILFSYLRLNGVKAREHPVFKELTRVKQYFNKIKAAETPPTSRDTLSMNKQAAARFIRAGLIGNDKYDLERARRQRNEKLPPHIQLEDLSRKNKSENAISGLSAVIDQSDESSSDSGVQEVQETIDSLKKRKADAISDPDPTSSLSSDSELPKDQSKKTKSEKHKSKKSKKNKSKG